MGGGGNTSRFVGPWTEKEQEKITKSFEKEREILGKDVDHLLNNLLSYYNNRDRDGISEKLGELSKLLGKNIEIDSILFGGSVAKHTDVDGLSDVDALVILGDGEEECTPKELLNNFLKILRTKLPRANIDEIKKGTLAITINYSDGTEIQLLPAFRSGSKISISNSDGKTWNETKPKVFQRELTKANAAMNGCLVPTIKLLKSINSKLPEQKKLTGYHIEALSIDAVKGYGGPKTPRNLLLHILKESSSRVKNPMQDKTGQERALDSYLGKSDSIKRLTISQTLLSIKRRLESAQDLSQWRAIFED